MGLITEEKMNKLKERSEAAKQEALAAPKSLQRPEVACSEWVDALVRRWMERVKYYERERSYDTPQLDHFCQELRQCIYELMEAKPRASTDSSSATSSGSTEH